MRVQEAAKGESQARLSCTALIVWEASEEKPVHLGGGLSRFLLSCCKFQRRGHQWRCPEALQAGSRRPPTAPSLEPSDSPATWSALPGPHAMPRACVPWHSLIVLCWKKVKWKTGACGNNSVCRQIPVSVRDRLLQGHAAGFVAARVGVKQGSPPAGGAPWSSRAPREAVLCRCPGRGSHRGSASNPCCPLQVEGPPFQSSLCGVPSAA